MSNQQSDNDKKEEDIDLTSPQARGFNPGDDDALQAAIRKNLAAVHEEHKVEGRHEEAAGVKEHLDALEKLYEIEKQNDPHDEVPDDPRAG